MSNRSELIRLASEMPKGSQERKDLLNFINRSASVQHNHSGKLVILPRKPKGQKTVGPVRSVDLEVVVLMEMPGRGYLRGEIHTTLNVGDAGPRNFWFTKSRGSDGLSGLKENELIGLLAWSYQQDSGPWLSKLG